MPVDDTSRIVGKQYFIDEQTFAKPPVFPANSFGNAEFDPSDPLAAASSKVRLRKTYSQANAAAATETRGLHIVTGTTATIKEIMISNSARATGGATVVIRVRKNGNTVLTGDYTLDNAHPASGAGYASAVANLDPAQADCVRGDVIDVVITATVGGGVLPTEVMVQVTIDEDPA